MGLRREDFLIHNVEAQEPLATFVPGPPDGEMSEAIPNCDIQAPLLAEHYHHVAITAGRRWCHVTHLVDQRRIYYNNDRPKRWGKKGQ